MSESETLLQIIGILLIEIIKYLSDYQNNEP